MSSSSSNDISGLIRAGSAALRIGDYDAARATFERAVQLDPANQEARIGLRDAQRRLGSQAAVTPATVEQVEYCYRHPDRETALHCTSCNRPICYECSHPAAVGQLCPECLRGRRAPNYQVSAATLAKGGVTALVISSLAAALLSLVGGFWFLLFFIGPAIGELIVRGVDWATRNKRGRPVQITVATAMVLSAALVFFLGYGNPLTLLIYLLLGVSTVVARLR